jgi:hypothetical protein
VIALLCWQKNFTLLDFIVPQKYFVEAWSRAKKRAGKDGEIEFWVRRKDETFFLEVDGSLINITDLRGDYAPLR